MSEIAKKERYEGERSPEPPTGRTCMAKSLIGEGRKNNTQQILGGMLRDRNGGFKELRSEACTGSFCSKGRKGNV